MSGIPLLGEKMPSLNVVTTQGAMTLPDVKKGKWFVLFSHPADFTPVCTTEFVAFQRRAKEFAALGCDLVGLSIDQVFSHLKWIEWMEEKLGEKIEFPVIADDMGRVAMAMGMVHESKGTNTVRAVFIVDPEGRLRLMLYYPQEIGRNIDEILRAVKALQTSDKLGVALPAGWPNNELIGGECIVPPAKDAKGMAERKGQSGCFDWWFCHKKI